MVERGSRASSESFTAPREVGSVSGLLYKR